MMCHSLQFPIEFVLLDDEAQNESDSSMLFSLSPPGSPSDNLSLRFQSYKRVGMDKYMLKIEQAIQNLHKKEEDQNRRGCQKVARTITRKITRSFESVTSVKLSSNQHLAPLPGCTARYSLLSTPNQAISKVGYLFAKTT